MDDDTLTNYLNDARLNRAEFIMLQNLNNRILRKCNNESIKLNDALKLKYEKTKDIKLLKRTNETLQKVNEEEILTENINMI